MTTDDTRPLPEPATADRIYSWACPECGTFVSSVVRPNPAERARHAALVAAAEAVAAEDCQSPALDALRAALLAELEAGVLTELTHDKVAARMQAVGRPWTVGEAVKAAGDIVLDLIQQVTSK